MTSSNANRRVASTGSACDRASEVVARCIPPCQNLATRHDQTENDRILSGRNRNHARCIHRVEFAGSEDQHALTRTVRATADIDGLACAEKRASLDRIPLLIGRIRTDQDLTRTADLNGGWTTGPEIAFFEQGTRVGKRLANRRTAGDVAAQFQIALARDPHQATRTRSAATG